MIIGLMILFWVLGIVFLIIWACVYDNGWIFATLSGIFVILGTAILIFGLFHGFINYPKTEGTHTGEIMAVDLEGKYFRRYEIYLKSSAYTDQGDETKYLIYADEEELAEQLKNAIGKKVKLTYGHDGGYIGWKSCGTYHIKSVEILEEN